MHFSNRHSVSGFRASIGIAIVLVGGGALVASSTVLSGATPAIAPAVAPSSHPVPVVNSQPPNCPTGKLYQPGGTLCIDGVRIKAAPSGMPLKKAEIFYGEEELAASRIGKPIREPYVAPNAPGMIQESNGSYALVRTINIPKSGEISTAPPDNRIPPIIETSQWEGWSGNTFLDVQAGTDIATGNAAVLVTTQIETQVVSPNSGVYGPGAFNGEVLISPSVKGTLKVTASVDDMLTLELVGTSTKYQFNMATDTFMN